MGVFTIVVQAGRLLRAHWPALLAWFLAGILARYVVIEIAGFVGAYTAVGGMLLLPLAILARLISFVAMFLVLRDGMRQLGRIAPAPHDPAGRRRAFVDALLGGILPFFAFYAARGYLSEDVSAYLTRGLEVQAGEILGTLDTGETITTEATLTDLQLGPITAVMVVVAYAGRWAWKRHRARLPASLSIVAVYLEAVWVFVSVTLIAQLLGGLRGWVDGRQAMAWVTDARAAIGEAFAPVAWLWQGVDWLVRELGGVILVPMAWLTIAGVIYGQAVVAQAPRLSSPRLERVRKRMGKIPGQARRRLSDVGKDLTGRFRSIWNAVVLMWQAGPVLIGGFVLLYTLVQALTTVLGIGFTRALGPHDFQSFWAVFGPLLFLVVPILIEPLRLSIVASAYDSTIGTLISSELEKEAGETGDGVEDLDVDDEGTDGVLGHEIVDDHGVGDPEVGQT